MGFLKAPAPCALGLSSYWSAKSASRNYLSAQSAALAAVQF
jgi:hypothetical protein